MNNALKVLEALSLGITVEIDGREYRWDADMPNDKDMYFEGLSIVGEHLEYKDGEYISKGEVLMGRGDMPINHFIKMCEDATEKEMFDVNTSLALHKMTKKHQSGKKRGSL